MTTLAIDELVALCALFLLIGLVFAARERARRRVEAITAYEGGKRAQRAVDLAKLRKLRELLEEGEEGVLAADACLLYDVCQALQLSDGEAQHVLGVSYLLVIEAPIMPAAVPFTFAGMHVCLACGRVLPDGEQCTCGGSDDYAE